MITGADNDEVVQSSATVCNTVEQLSSESEVSPVPTATSIESDPFASPERVPSLSTASYDTEAPTLCPHIKSPSTPHIPCTDKRPPPYLRVPIPCTVTESSPINSNHSNFSSNADCSENHRTSECTCNGCENGGPVEIASSPCNSQIRQSNTLRMLQGGQVWSSSGRLIKASRRFADDSIPQMYSPHPKRRSLHI